MREKINLTSFLPYRLAYIADLVSRNLQHHYATKYQLTVAEWRTLVTLGEFEKMTAKMIGDHASMHKTKVSRAVATLNRHKWLKREANENDRREEYLSLTPKGEIVYGEAVILARKFQQDILSSLGEDSEKLSLLLDRLENHFTKTIENK